MEQPSRGPHERSAVSPHPIYSQNARVHLVAAEDMLACFRQAIIQSGFSDHLQGLWRASGKLKQNFRIAIKPNIMTASIQERDSPVYTDPRLVEELIGQLREQGFSQIAVVETQNVYNYSYTGRTVRAVAQLCGYSGEGYQVLDLSEDSVEFDYGGPLGRHRVGRVWLEADYRISFAKNKSHWQCFYTACLKNVYGCLPEWDKMKHYHGRGIEFFQSTVLIADAFPVHFGFLDAWTSGDGLTGHVRDAHPNPTRVILASDNIYALDWVAGEKMQIRPTKNYVLQEALKRWGPIRIERVGDRTPWYPWRNVRPLVVASLNLLEEFYWFSRIMSRAMASRMDVRFPPVSRWQWFFGITQALVRLIEGILTSGVKPALPDEHVYEMSL